MSDQRPDDLFDDSTWLSAYADGQLDGEQRAEAERRLGADDALRRELAEVVAARDALRDLAPVEPPPGFVDDLVARVVRISSADDAPGARTEDEGDVVDLAARRRRSVGGLAAGIAAAAVVVLALALPGGDDATPELPVLAEAHLAETAAVDPIAQLPALAIPAGFTP